MSIVVLPRRNLLITLWLNDPVITRSISFSMTYFDIISGASHGFFWIVFILSPASFDKISSMFSMFC